MIHASLIVRAVWRNSRRGRESAPTAAGCRLPLSGLRVSKFWPDKSEALTRIRWMNKRRLVRPAPSRFHSHWPLARQIVFLNHGSFGSCPKAVLKIQSELRRNMEAEPVQFLWRHYEERLEPARRALGRFIGGHPRDIVFVTNATSGVNAVARSLPLRRGDALLTTNLDYNACHNVVVETAGRAGAEVQVARVPFPLSKTDQILEAIMNAVTGRTRLALIDHVSSHSALVLPIAQIVRAL